MAMHVINPGVEMHYPNFDVKELPDGNLLVSMKQEGTEPVEFVIHPRSALHLAQVLTRLSLDQSRAAFSVPLQALR